MEKQPYRVLQVVTIMNRGGIETMIMNHYRAIDRTKIQFDFLVHRQERGDYDDEIVQLGGRIYRAFPIRPWKYIQYFKWLNIFFKDNNSYIAIHSHIQENSGLVFKIASKYNLNNLIANSHIATLGVDYKYLFRQYGRILTNKYSTTKLACGVKAGKFLYGNKTEFIILKNAIKSEEFSFDLKKREYIRKQLGINENFVIGNISRFCTQKNHSFIIDIFEEIYKINSSAKLLLIGDGPLKADIIEKVKNKSIYENIIFMGIRSDIPDLLQAIDVILFPSLFEGLPVSIIESQAAGLPCVLSDTIDPDVKITPNVDFVSLKAPTSNWCDSVISKQSFKRTSTQEYIISSGYDLSTSINKLTQIYFQALKI